MFYYEVALPVEPHWESSLFTYSSPNEIALCSIVLVPFGKKKMTGIIRKEVPRPTFTTKGIVSVLPYKNLDVLCSFIDWYGSFYAEVGGMLYKQFIPAYLTQNTKKPASPFNSRPPQTELSRQQLDAVDKLLSSDTPSVLHGITGSGKTKIYEELIKRSMAQGKSSLLLYPEISLTPQLLSTLGVPGNVYVFHSQLSDAERSKLWHTIAQSKEVYTVIGPRSSLFLPHKNLGLIIIDEAHETSYKQETDIRYNSLYVAGGLARAHNAKLLFGSATPPISETQQLTAKGRGLVCLHEKAIVSSHGKEIKIIDKKNRQLFKKHPQFSDEMLRDIQVALSNKQQSLIFLNRRGTSKRVACSNEGCEWVAVCTDCELPLTYHHDLYQLLCHTCGKKYSVPSSCPVSGHGVSMKVLGNKALVQELEKLFPSAKIGRYDSDNSEKDSFAANYEKVYKGEIDILIGTQQLSKGLDLPKLRFVGVVDADLSLNFPDYSSEERTFQLIAQVAGRVARGHSEGKILIQTRNPDNHAIRMAAEEDWHAFNNYELENRKKHHFPPFIHAAKLIFRDKSRTKALNLALAIKEKVIVQGISVDGPIDSFISKRGSYCYVELHLKSKSRSKILKCTEKLDRKLIIDVDPISLL